MENFHDYSLSIFRGEYLTNMVLIQSKVSQSMGLEDLYRKQGVIYGKEDKEGAWQYENRLVPKF